MFVFAFACVYDCVLLVVMFSCYGLWVCCVLVRVSFRFVVVFFRLLVLSSSDAFRFRFRFRLLIWLVCVVLVCVVLF